ncbi:MAG: ACT domain-containing protein [Bdellovibrionales bacterium]|nr:ACT domain-containing protein [Bdellovibrionales bacterium]
MDLKELGTALTVFQLHPDSPLPDFSGIRGFFSVTRTPEEVSIVCETDQVPMGDFKREDGWKCIQVVGPLDFSLTGVLFSIAAPLADGKISIFAVSTFNTDYLLIKQGSYSKARDLLIQAGFRFA